jgi:cytochrome P450
MGLIRKIEDGRAFRRDPLTFVLGLGEWRDVMQIGAGFTQFTLINHPDLIRRILVTESRSYGEGKWTIRGKHVMHDCLITREGPSHRERRGLVGPSFDRRRLAEYGPGLVRAAESLGHQWQDGQHFEARDQMGQLGITMAGIALFETDLEAEAAELRAALAVLSAAISRLPLPRPRVALARKRVERTVLRLSHSHLLSHLRDAGLTEAEVVDEVISLMMAAVDSTARALAWIWLMLGRNGSIQVRFHEELEAVLAGKPVTVADLPRLTFMEMLVEETLRLYPPVHFIDRRTLTDVDLDGVHLPAGTYLLLSPLITQRDPRFFEDPTAFKPERWNASAPDRPTARLSFPFGAGRHRCIGEELARLEISLALATLASSWRLRPGPEIPADPSPQLGRMPLITERRV